ncbi:MAG: hypothetical protein EPO51_07490 [Phenylobacterium sp.]|uniref:phytanoyl-CoA dioxygenase family protein n=1 Tax=Phenylobacterium sp. TaxID=1871053 RepID=UPI0011FF0108|nr:phytanoyl-CoA dioxygenase family protein [Phenylobacterium sp.]TAJ72763.1 MAG: hypothetical protein EPO51_07490 [Phenylobacterium sp.]
MRISDQGASPHADAIMKEIARYDLFENVVELEAYGLTVVPPEKLRTAEGFIERLRDAMITTCEKRNGIPIGDRLTASPPKEAVDPNKWDVLEEDEVFVEAATNPAMLALVRWLCGESAVLAGQTWIIKGREGRTHALHSDSHGIPPGGGSIAHMCNASWICTDYASVDDGPTVFAPGTHKFGRATLPHEADLAMTAIPTIPLIAKAGSLAIWNGATWHASLPRNKDGLRITLVQNYMRSYMRPQVLYDRTVSPQLRQKFPELDRVVGRPLYPYIDSQNVDGSRVAPFIATGTDPYA